MLWPQCCDEVRWFVCNFQHIHNFKGGFKLQKNACSDYGKKCTRKKYGVLNKKESLVCVYDIQRGVFEFVEGICYMHRLTCRNEAGKIVN